MEKELNFKAFRAVNDKELETLEREHRIAEEITYEAMPWAINTKYVDIARDVIQDRMGKWARPVILLISEHNSIIGAKSLAKKAVEFFNEESKKFPFDVLSVSAGMENEKLILKSLLRIYSNLPDMQKFFEYIGDDLVKKEHTESSIKGQLLIPDEIKNFKYTDDEIKEHDADLKKQEEVLKHCSIDKPFLNQIDHYVPHKLANPEDCIPLVYDLKTKDMSLNTITDYETFTNVFRDVLCYVNGVEYYHFIQVLAEEETTEEFMSFLETYIKDKFIEKRILAAEDLPKLLDKLYNALFKLYVVQDLIDDPDVTDIKITAPDAIRVRVKGKAYISNINFVDRADYLRFINGICIRNRVSQDTPDQTFTDTHDENYILRFSLYAEYINSVNWPYMHIRKVARKKLMAPDLIKKGMFDEKIRDYLLDCGKTSRGVVFAGPPGSGKTVCLNWFIEEAYEDSAEILVIQENDELFCYRKGVMFQHVVNYSTAGKPAVDLEELGQLALVAGANVFVIGEAKGAEICSAITLSNSGCRTAITIHSPSSTETIDKMADLAMRGYAKDPEQAKRMLKSFQTIVYLEDFQVKEISEIIGYDEEKKDMKYRYIYRKEEPKNYKEAS